MSDEKFTMEMPADELEAIPNDVLGLKLVERARCGGTTQRRSCLDASLSETRGVGVPASVIHEAIIDVWRFVLWRDWHGGVEHWGLMVEMIPHEWHRNAQHAAGKRALAALREGVGAILGATNADEAAYSVALIAPEIRRPYRHWRWHNDGTKPDDASLAAVPLKHIITPWNVFHAPWGQTMWVDGT